VLTTSLSNRNSKFVKFGSSVLSSLSVIRAISKQERGRLFVQSDFSRSVWSLKLCLRFFTFFHQKCKKVTFLSCCALFLERWIRACVNLLRLGSAASIANSLLARALTAACAYLS